jgi:hypothetical protein
VIVRRAVVVLVCLSVTAACGGRDPYAVYRQARGEPIPGTFAWTLQPPSGGTPRLSPAQAYRRLPGAGTEPDVMATLAIIENGDDGSRTPTAWVFITRNLCYFTAKGDLVSPGRSGGDGCTPDNLLVQAVDADTGDLVRVFSAFDLTHGWSPDREGDPATAQATGTTRFH